MKYKEIKEEYKVGLLLIAVLFSQTLWFSVVYTGASWNEQERQMPNLFQPVQISQKFDNDLSVIADNLHWSLATAYESAKQPVLSFIGVNTDLDQGYVAQPSFAFHHIFRSNNSFAENSVSNSAPKVLGAFTSRSHATHSK